MKILALTLCLLVAGTITKAVEVKNLRCEYLVNPVGVDAPSPRLSWMIQSTQRGDLQQAFQIIVSSSPENLSKAKGDLWDTGKLISDQSILVNYRGKPLKPGTKYFWKVRIWNIDGKPSAWSKPSFWSMGLLSKGDWGSAQWIALKDGEQWKKEWKQHKDSELSNLPPVVWPNTSWPWKTGKDSTIFTLYEMAQPKYDPSPLFRKEFLVNKKIRSANLYICGLGYYEAFLNGEKVGDHVLDPAWTNFEQRSMYVSYDVTSQINQGGNAIGVMLGRGQYNPLCNDIWGLSNSFWIDQPKLIAMLRIEFTDGTSSNVKTDSSWKTSGGPVVYDDTRHGELYDARLEQKGWSSPAFNESSWKSASVVQWNARLESQMIPPVRCFTPLAPVKTYKKGNGRTVYDIGKNIAGWARVKVRGASGSRVLVEYCETPSDSELVSNLTPSSFQHNIKDKNYASFYDKNVNVRQQNGYILRGGGEETFECHFSYKGFRFIRVTADDGVIVEQVVGVPVHTDVEISGDFSCSNPVINQTQKNAVNSLLNNYHSIATDCPHREKQGWTADNYMSAQAAMYNFNMAGFYTKWLTDLAGTQNEQGGLCTVAPSSNYDQNASTVWPAAIVFIPWDILGFYGDTLPAKNNLEVMHRFAKSSLSREVEGKPEIINDVLGDWVAPLMVLNDTLRNNTMAPPEGMTLYGTASHFLVVKRLSEINKILGRAKESREMDTWSKRISKSFNHEFFDEKSQHYHGDKPTEYRQSANVVPLDYGLVSKETQEAVIQNLVRDIHEKGDRLSTGFLGTASLMAWLPEVDPELAYKLATQKKYPGWGYMVEQGANSMWETWDGYSSHNHPPFCLISAYFYKYLAGIQPDQNAPGFKHFIINPSIVGDLNYVNAYHDCPYGRIISNWKRENGKFILKLSIPVNTTATVYVPKIPGSVILESGKNATLVRGIKYLREENGKAIYKVVSGNYIFQSIIQDTIPPRIDTHIHLYDTRREGSSTFLDPAKHEKIYFPHFAEQFVDVAAPAGVEFAVVVEASQRREDNFWLMNHVGTSDVLLAFIANLDPRDSWFVKDLDLLSKSRKFRGIRIRPTTPINLSDPEIIERFAELEKRNLVLELGVNGVDPAAVLTIARRYPKMNIIINHLAGGKIFGDAADREIWKARLTVLAAEPNVYCKVSALFDLSGQNPAPINSDFYNEMIDPVVNAFGPDRVLFGSNWTLSDLFGSYKDMVRMLDHYIVKRKDLSAEKFYFENAKKAYGIK